MSEIRVLHAVDKKKTIYGAGDEYAFLADGSHTNGRYFIMEAVVPPGGGPPPHVQTREEEAFYILEGEVTFFGDNQTIRASTGSFLHIPSGAVHNFKNESDTTARMLIFFAPAGIEGMFDEMAADPESYAAIGREYGVEFL